MSVLHRISVPISEEINEKFSKILPWGVKAQIVRELIQLFIATYEGPDGQYIAQDLLNGKCKLTRSKFEQAGGK